MEGNALARLLDNAIDYDNWRVAFDPRLQRATMISGISLMSLMLNLVLVPALLNMTYSEYFMFGGEFLRSVLYFMYAGQPWLLGFTGVSLALYGVLLYKTDQLEAGAKLWHNLATVEVILGSLGGFLMALEITIILANLVIWIVVGIIVIVMLGAMLAGMAAGQ